MRIHRTFVWRDHRADGSDAISSDVIASRAVHQGVAFELRNWLMRYADGSRHAEAVYDEIISRPV